MILALKHTCYGYIENILCFLNTMRCVAHFAIFGLVCVVSYPQLGLALGIFIIDE